jgi:hypothetical protein
MQPRAANGQDNVPLTAHTEHLELKVAEKNGDRSYPLSPNGSLQLAQKAGVPVDYYYKMLGEGMADLTAKNVNAWLAKNDGERRLVRILDGNVRALLSDKYRALDNYDLAFQVMDRAKQHQAVVQTSVLSETRMHIKLTVPDYIAEVKQGDRVVPGLYVSNSEVGAGAFTVEPFLWRLVCSNGIVSENALRRIHIGQKLELGELIYKDDTRKAQDDALWKQVRDIIDSTFNRQVLDVLVERMRDSNLVPIEKPREAVEVVAQDLSLGDDAKADLLTYFAKETGTGKENLFGLVNGITRLAQDKNRYDDQIDVERYAGKLLATMATPVAK